MEQQEGVELEDKQFGLQSRAQGEPDQGQDQISLSGGAHLVHF